MVYFYQRSHVIQHTSNELYLTTKKTESFTVEKEEENNDEPATARTETLQTLNPTQPKSVVICSKNPKYLQLRKNINGDLMQPNSQDIKNIVDEIRTNRQKFEDMSVSKFFFFYRIFSYIEPLVRLLPCCKNSLINDRNSRLFEQAERKFLRELDVTSILKSQQKLKFLFQQLTKPQKQLFYFQRANLVESDDKTETEDDFTAVVKQNREESKEEEKKLFDLLQRFIKEDGEKQSSMLEKKLLTGFWTTEKAQVELIENQHREAEKNSNIENIETANLFKRSKTIIERRQYRAYNQDNLNCLFGKSQSEVIGQDKNARVRSTREVGGAPVLALVGDEMVPSVTEENH